MRAAARWPGGANALNPHQPTPWHTPRRRVLVAPHRLKRPWKGQVEPPFDFSSIPRMDRTNPLAPGAPRGEGTNPEYTSTYVFQNDFPSLSPGNPAPTADEAARHRLLRMGCAPCRTRRPPTTDHQSQSPKVSPPTYGLALGSPARGDCRVMCFHPHTNVTLPLMEEAEIVAVIDEWARQVVSAAGTRPRPPQGRTGPRCTG